MTWGVWGKKEVALGGSAQPRLNECNHKTAPVSALALALPLAPSLPLPLPCTPSLALALCNAPSACTRNSFSFALCELLHKEAVQIIEREPLLLHSG